MQAGFLEIADLRPPTLGLECWVKPDRVAIRDDGDLVGTGADEVDHLSELAIVKELAVGSVPCKQVSLPVAGGEKLAVRAEVHGASLTRHLHLCDLLSRRRITHAERAAGA